MSVLSVSESEKLRKLTTSASWIERYLVGVAYCAFVRPNVSPSYEVLESSAFHDMQIVVNRLNAELKKLGFNKEILLGDRVDDLVNNLRPFLMESTRANALDWLVGNKNEAFWEEAKEKEAWKLDDEALISFCADLSAKIKAAKAQN